MALNRHMKWRKPDLQFDPRLTAAFVNALETGGGLKRPANSRQRNPDLAPRNG